MVTVASFYAPRPEDFPDAPDYLPMLRLLQASCDKFGHRHVVISDQQIEGFETHVVPLPRGLMAAILFGQRDWIARGDWSGRTVMVGADCLINRDLNDAFTSGWDLCLTNRVHKRWPINTGAIYLNGGMRIQASTIWARMAAEVTEQWGDDQVRFAQVFAPVPAEHGIFERRHIQVQFAPMETHNHSPKLAEQRSGAFVVHFKGQRKRIMAAWARKHLGIAA